MKQNCWRTQSNPELKSNNRSTKRDSKIWVLLTTSTTITRFYATILSCQCYCNTSYCSPYCLFFTQKPDFFIEKASQRGGIVEDFGCTGLVCESPKTPHKDRESNQESKSKDPQIMYIIKLDDKISTKYREVIKTTEIHVVSAFMWEEVERKHIGFCQP